MHRTRTAPLVAMLAALLMLVAAAPAHASTSRLTDGDDSSTPLDLASAKLTSKGNKIIATIAMHDAFTDEQLAAPSTIGVDFRINGTMVRGLAARVVGGVLKGDVCTYKQGGSVLGSNCSSVSAVRVDDRTIRLTVKRAKVSKAEVLRWRAGAAYLVATCSDPLACLDTAPGGPSSFKTWRV